MEHLAQQRMKKKQYLRRFTTTAINAWVLNAQKPRKYPASEAQSPSQDPPNLA